MTAAANAGRPCEARRGKPGVEMSDDLFDVWFEGLLTELKKSSTGDWESGKRVFRAMPNTIERVIKAHSEGLNNDPELLRSYYEGAKIRSNQLAQQGDEDSARSVSTVRN